ncbi:hypothetical protein A5721_18835 [Mycobacterium vulneris]|nr:hypothetical protein A5721_18835 [Mycolicibacterium vulneris]
MTTTTPHRYTVTDGSVSIAACGDCGSLIGDPVTHAHNCPRILPPPPAPLTYDQHAIAGIMTRHNPIFAPGGYTVGCRCNTHARFDGYNAWCGHVANAIATTLGGAR